MHHDDPQAIESMLRYLYTLDTGTVDWDVNETHMSLHRLCVLEIADKYDIRELACWALDKLQTTLRQGAPRSIESEEHAELVRAVYADDIPVVVEQLRKDVVHAGITNRNTESYKSHQRQLILDCPEYAVDLVEACLERERLNVQHGGLLYDLDQYQDFSLGRDRRTWSELSELEIWVGMVPRRSIR